MVGQSSHELNVPAGPDRHNRAWNDACGLGGKDSANPHITSAGAAIPAAPHSAECGQQVCHAVPDGHLGPRGGGRDLARESTDGLEPATPTGSETSGGPLQFSLRSLVVTVALAAVGLAALVHPSPAWAMVVTNGSFLLVVVATLAAIFRLDGRARATVGSFAVCAWIYLLVGWIVQEHFTVWPFRRLGPAPLVTTWLLNFAFELTFEKTDEDWWRDGSKARFMCIGHWLSSLAMGLIGGLLGRYFHAAKACRKSDRGPRSVERTTMQREDSCCREG